MTYSGMHSNPSQKYLLFNCPTVPGILDSIISTLLFFPPFSLDSLSHLHKYHFALYGLIKPTPRVVSEKATDANTLVPLSTKGATHGEGKRRKGGSPIE